MLQVWWGDLCLAWNIDEPGTLTARQTGLLNRESMQPGDGMFLIPCVSIHTVGMRFPIDVLFLSVSARELVDSAGNLLLFPRYHCHVVSVHWNVQPGMQMLRPPLSKNWRRNAMSCLELPGGMLQQLGGGPGPGEQITFLRLPEAA